MHPTPEINMGNNKKKIQIDILQFEGAVDQINLNRKNVVD